MVLSNQITKVPFLTFFNCKSVAEINIPESVTSLGDSVFSYCNNLLTLHLSDNITIIGWDILYNCASLQNVNIPSSLTVIPSEMFMVVLP